MGQTFKDFEAIVVDNGSKDGSVEFIRREYGKFVKLLQNERNLGVAAGNNAGIKYAEGEYIVILNNDTWSKPTWLEELVKGIDSDSHVRGHHP